MTDGNTADTFEDVVRCVKRHLNDGMCARSVARDTELDKNIPWTPTLSGKLHSYRRIAVEVSTETVYPEIIKLAHPDILKAQFLLDVYAACPEELLQGSSGYKTQRNLQHNGIGLLVVQADGTVYRQHGTIPLVQQISSSQFAKQTKELPKWMRARSQQAYDTYNTEPVDGLKALSELIEAAVFGAARRLYRSGAIPADPEANDLNKVLKQIQSGPSVPSHIKGAVPGVDDFRSRCRNIVSHSPKSFKAAQERADRARRSFESGLDLLSDWYRFCRKDGVRI